MAKLSPPRYTESCIERLCEGECDGCGGSESVTSFALGVGGRKPTVRLSLCIACVLYAAERRSGFGFLNQLRNWQRASVQLSKSAPAHNGPRKRANGGIDHA